MTAGPAYALRRLPVCETDAELIGVQAALVCIVSGLVLCAGYLPACAMLLSASVAVQCTTAAV